MTQGEYLRDAPSEELSCGRTEKFLRGGTDHDGASITGEQQQAVFEASHDGIHVFSHRAEYFVHPAQLLADLGYLQAYQSQFVAAPCEAFRLRRRRVVLSCGNAIQLRGDVTQRGERRAAH